ncbi:tRNA (guanosine(37)-N1)-methyltransferase TrmD, partial [Candidatus Roizmanbacteria bacterium]|nr:tRNA (guanosine(37)-N1)-methyltransferase TrmD [Candidatus Roizmanbacteria bacterium]
MRITILTLFPQMISSFFKESIIKRAQEKGVVAIEVVDIRTYTHDNYHTVDDRPYGGGTGMVMKLEPLVEALHAQKRGPNSKVVITSPQGQVFNQAKASELKKLEELVIICGHYEGVDARVAEFIDEEISLGDFVMTGGEITAAAIADAVTRLIPGVLAKEDVTVNESFYFVPLSEVKAAVGETPELRALAECGVKQVQLLEYPQYTRPEVFEGQQVPEVLL